MQHYAIRLNTSNTAAVEEGTVLGRGARQNACERGTRAPSPPTTYYDGAGQTMSLSSDVFGSGVVTNL